VPQECVIKVERRISFLSLFSLFSFNGRVLNEIQEDERFLIDRGFKASMFFMKFAMTSEINVWRERVYELLTYSILLFSPTRLEIGMNRWRSKLPVSSVNGIRFSPMIFHPVHGADDKNLYGECVDASLHSVKHCTSWSIILYIRTCHMYIRQHIFSKTFFNILRVVSLALFSSISLSLIWI